MNFLKEQFFSTLLLYLIIYSFLFIFFFMLYFSYNFVFMKQVLLLWKLVCLYLTLFKLNRRQKLIVYRIIVKLPFTVPICSIYGRYICSIYLLDICQIYSDSSTLTNTTSSAQISVNVIGLKFTFIHISIINFSVVNNNKKKQNDYKVMLHKFRNLGKFCYLNFFRFCLQ